MELVREIETIANLLAIPVQFEIFGKRDLFSRSVKKMQLFEAEGSVNNSVSIR